MKELSMNNYKDTLPMTSLAKHHAKKSFNQTAIFGLGNELLGDKGIGVHAARQLKGSTLAKEVKIVEVGTAILDTLLALKYAERIIVLDAMTAGGAPGTVYRTPVDHHDGTPCIASMHGFEIFREIALAGRKREKPLPIMVFGMEPESIGWSMTLSSAVTDSLPSLIDAVREELGDQHSSFTG